MKVKDVKVIDGRSKKYLQPKMEIIVVRVEQGFATSSGNNESWNETPGGGDF